MMWQSSRVASGVKWKRTSDPENEVCPLDFSGVPNGDAFSVANTESLKQAFVLNVLGIRVDVHQRRRSIVPSYSLLHEIVS